MISHLDKEEVDAPLAAPDSSTWTGGRDRAAVLTPVQTGLRVCSSPAAAQHEHLFAIPRET